MKNFSGEILRKDAHSRYFFGKIFFGKNLGKYLGKH